MSGRNVLGGELVVCGTDPLTGWTRTGCCAFHPADLGQHVVCAVVTERFLRYTASQGNDLSTPRGGFRGLRPGDRWCLCASRWQQAYVDGMAPPVVLEACDERALAIVALDVLREHAVAPDAAPEP
ncbi:DUF2237 domain-containing protein [Patulibacter brassicae]|uniref:DUF2237 domain-containing protein n=1 Tax=Patulibacter brassicae TaxID=1705717 RepID=A0ABU4VPT4_9ACTN|nr:DUF2237 domain-containing protein [Patulibacter brassicae]MDX8153879.1 DUF2237 domain-containing protein [Patulibacter brassicae]